MSSACDVVIAEFVYGVMRCGDPAVGTITTDQGDVMCVCLEHCQPARESGYLITPLKK